MKERAADEQKAESAKLKAVMERHKALIPKIQETLVKTECYWKCYSYGDDLIPIFEFIDDLRNKSIREVFTTTLILCNKADYFDPEREKVRQRGSVAES